MRSTDHVVCSGAFGAQNDEALFLKLGRAWCSFYRKPAGTRHVGLVFLHPVGSVCHVVHSGASGAQNVEVLFFMLRLDRYTLHKMRAGTR
jgi:hypothetical protein